MMDYKEYLKQLSIVILGILIAFWVNNIGMRYKEHKTEKQVLSTIFGEIEDNNDAVRSTIANLDSLRMAFMKVREIMAESDPGVSEVYLRYTGLNVKNIGYETAKYTGILKDIDHELASEIVENYETQNSLKELEKMMRDELFQFIKIQEKDNIDYMLIQIENLTTNLKSFEGEQRQLIDDLTGFRN